nr:DNA helicase RecG [Bacillota bacterium]
MGPVRAAALERVGVRRVWDLLTLPPRRYLDYSRVVEPADAQPGEGAVRGRLGAFQRRPLADRPRVLLVESVLTGPRGRLTLHWFLPRNHARYVRFPPVGTTVVASGPVRAANGRLTMVNPVLEEEGRLQVAGRLLPVYPLSQGLSQGVLRRLVDQALDAYLPLVEEYLPEAVRAPLALLPLEQAIERLHRPENLEEATQARRRLVFDELFLWNWSLEAARAARQAQAAPALGPPGPLAARFLEQLPFSLTDGQREAMAVLDEDLTRPFPMRRLLQGDVGSGKTVVAAYALLRAVESGLQAALVVPTGVLCRQQEVRLQELYRGLGVRVLRYTGSLNEAERAQVEAELASGQPLVVVATHLFANLPRPPRLGLVVVDEEQRFGVRLRQALAGEGVHQLHMTATPVPRTLALTAYGDLDVTVLRGLPPGRHPVDTRWIPERKRDELYRFVRARVEAGERAFIIFPAIDSETQAQALVEQVRVLARGPLAGIPIGVVHGRLPEEERWSTLEAFRSGEVPVLAATTVVEVGVDVPEASVMVVEGADRFGLAQLHQLRGRVARSRSPAFCFLVATPRTPQARGRLNAMRTLDDGFAIAEADLRLRGPGELLGEAQWGAPEWRLASLPEDEGLLREARQALESYIEQVGWETVEGGPIGREAAARAEGEEGWGCG